MLRWLKTACLVFLQGGSSCSSQLTNTLCWKLKRVVAIALWAAHYNFSICYPVELQPVFTFFLRIFVHRHTPWQTRICFNCIFCTSCCPCYYIFICSAQEAIIWKLTIHISPLTTGMHGQALTQPCGGCMILWLQSCQSYDHRHHMVTLIKSNLS